MSDRATDVRRIVDVSKRGRARVFAHEQPEEDPAPADPQEQADREMTEALRAFARD
jgi:hypothetical protein